MSLTAMWVHGSSIAVENLENVSGVRRFGFGTQTFLQPGKECWFHAAITTPVLVGDKRPNLARVIILFKSGASAYLNSLHIFDSNQRVLNLSNILTPSKLHGDHLLIGNLNRFPTLPKREILYGLGVTFKFAALEGTPDENREVFIASVGADFEFNP